jgi:hypothetical protein
MPAKQKNKKTSSIKQHNPYGTKDIYLFFLVDSALFSRFSHCVLDDILRRNLFMAKYAHAYTNNNQLGKKKIK